MMLADTVHIEPDLIGELDLLDEITQALRGSDRTTGLRIRGDLRERIDSDLHVGAPQSIGLRFATIWSRCGSRNGASTTFSPSVRASSSTVKPGPSVAISKRIPFGSRK